MSDSLSSPTDEPALARHLRETWSGETASFHMPGHKGGSGAPPLGIELFGRAVYEADLSEMGGFDYLHGPKSALIEAQVRAATLFGAERTWFLVNGSTVGNIASICATVRDGEEILVARGSHRSVYAGIIVSGARPVYLPPVHNAELDGLFGVNVRDAEIAMTARPMIRAVHITSPSYYGFTTGLADFARIAHHSDVPLIVDEAHGSHFVFHSDFPDCALSHGADLCIQSPHKTLGSLTQSSLLHLQGDRVEPGRVDGFLQMLQSSSPSALLLISLDLATDEMARSGAVRWKSALELAARVRDELNRITDLTVIGIECSDSPGINRFDPTKLVVDVGRLGLTGYDAAEWLKTHRRIHPEFADLRRMVFSITTGDTDETADLLIEALGSLASANHDRRPSTTIVTLWPEGTPEMALTPREASCASSVDVPTNRTIGRVCAEMVVPYPPGIPLIVPGELVDQACLDALKQLIEVGSQIVGMSNPSGTTLRCIAD